MAFLEINSQFLRRSGVLKVRFDLCVMLIVDGFSAYAYRHPAIEEGKVYILYLNKRIYT